jgi:hypothetical protein
MFLEHALESKAPLSFEDYMSCLPNGQTDRYVTLAKYRILSTHKAVDSVRAVAEVVTVAEETGHPHKLDHYVTTVRTRTDTVHWTLVRDARGEWGVCGYSREGVSLGHYGDDTDTDWKPTISSWKRVREIVAEIQRSK